MTDQAPLAETVSGTILYLTSLGMIYFGFPIPASVCLIMVGLIACARSYSRAIR